MFLKCYCVTFFIFSCYVVCLAQDTLYFANGTKKTVTVEEINEKNVVYKLFNFSDGPKYIEGKTNLDKIVYRNGLVDVFTHEKTVSSNQLEKPTTEEEIYIYPKDASAPSRLNDKQKNSALNQHSYNAFAFNSYELINWAFSMQYEYIPANSYIAIWMPLVIGINPVDRLKAIAKIEAKKNYSFGIGIKGFVGNPQNGRFVAPLIEYASLYYMNKSISTNTTVYNNGYAFIFSVNGGTNIRLTSNLYASFYFGLGGRYSHLYDTRIYPIMKGGLCLGVVF